MSGEDQERFEDYLELEHYIEELQAGRVAHPPAELTPGQASIYRMAALFRSSLPEANEPRPEFAAELLGRLEQELQQPSRANLAPAPPQAPKQPPKRSGVSRRSLLTGGAAIAASLIVGVGSGAAIEHAIYPTTGRVIPPNGNPNVDPWSTPLVPDNIPTVWHPVTTLAELGENAMPFSAGSVLGYIIRDDGDNGDPDKGQIIAMSAACTHMGCIVQWQDSDRKYHCPCHGGLFTEYGKVDAGAAPIRYLTPLPRLQTKVENGKVYVKVPASLT